MLVLKFGIIYDFDFGNIQEWKYIPLFGLSREFFLSFCTVPWSSLSVVIQIPFWKKTAVVWNCTLHTRNLCTWLTKHELDILPIWIILNTYNYSLCVLCFSYTQLHRDFIMRTDIFCTDFNVFNKPTMFLYICFIDAQSCPEVDQDGPKHVAVMTDCV